MDIKLAELKKDPYPIYSELRDRHPIAWVEELNMFYVTRFEDVVAILNDSEHFITGTEKSTIFDIFGSHMMTTEGDLHQRYKGRMRPPFLPKFVREHVEKSIGERVDYLLDSIQLQDAVEFRHGFAKRLPILVMLDLFGLPATDEKLLRGWYDNFELALDNYVWDPEVRASGKHSAGEFHNYLQRQIERFRNVPDSSALLSVLANLPEDQALTDSELRHNCLIVLFGGISTVEALILNALHVMNYDAEVNNRVRSDFDAIPKFLEEVVRFCGPVQTATRHLSMDYSFGGHCFRAGDTVNCVIASANRDVNAFSNPDMFDIDRSDLRKHIGFATGPHHCLGSHLARAEARIALERLFLRYPNFTFDKNKIYKVEGQEFRQPLAMHLNLGGE